MKIQSISYKVIAILGIIGIVAPLLVHGQSESKLQEIRQQLEEKREEITELQEKKEDKDEDIYSLEQELKSLDSDIENAEQELSSTNAQISGVQSELKDTREYINKLESIITEQRVLMEKYINALYTEPNPSLFQLFLTEAQLSDIMGSVKQTEAMQESITETIRIIESKEEEIRQEKKHLFDKEEELLSLRKLQEDQKRILVSKQKDKEYLLEETKGEQEVFTSMLTESRESRSQLLQDIELLGGGDTNGSLTPERAYHLAILNAERLDNAVRPEYLVGVMIVESRLGANVGNTYYKDALSRCANRPDNNTRINYIRQEEAFEQLVNKLGYGLNQPVSPCPHPQYTGTGGAMGPAQIMPTTWLSYESKLEKLKGDTVDPWNSEDAMLAIGHILLGKVGGQSIAGDESLERKAAMGYLGGGSHGWYADKVMREAERIANIFGSLDK